MIQQLRTHDVVYTGIIKIRFARFLFPTEICAAGSWFRSYRETWVFQRGIRL